METVTKDDLLWNCLVQCAKDRFGSSNVFVVQQRAEETRISSQIKYKLLQIVIPDVTLKYEVDAHAMNDLRLLGVVLEIKAYKLGAEQSRYNNPYIFSIGRTCLGYREYALKSIHPHIHTYEKLPDYIEPCSRTWCRGKGGDSTVAMDRYGQLVSDIVLLEQYNEEMMNYTFPSELDMEDNSTMLDLQGNMSSTYNKLCEDPEFFTFMRTSFKMRLGAERLLQALYVTICRQTDSAYLIQIPYRSFLVPSLTNPQDIQVCLDLINVSVFLKDRLDVVYSLKYDIQKTTKLLTERLSLEYLEAWANIPNSAKVAVPDTPIGYRLGGVLIKVQYYDDSKLSSRCVTNLDVIEVMTQAFNKSYAVKFNNAIE